MKIISVLIHLLFGLRALKSLSFLVYLWQLKEYRWDRLWLYAQSQTGKQELQQQLLANWQLRPIWRPKWTQRARLFFALSLGLVGMAVYIWLLPLSSWRLLLAWLVLSLALPLFVGLAAGLTALPARLVKARLLKQAEAKITARPDLLVIGVTGSYGKTAVVHILGKILSLKYKLLQTPASHNTLIAVAQLINDRLRPHHQVLLVEMGAYKKGEIAALCRLVKPKIGIITGINYQHLGLFKTFGSLLTAKYELIKALPADGLAVFNGANQYALAMAKKTKIKTRLFAQKPTHYQTNLIGAWQQQNIDAAMTVARELKVPRREAIKALTKIPAFPQQVKISTGLNKAVIIDDSYSLNPDGFIAALELFKDYQSTMRIIVTPGPIELGYKLGSTYRFLAKAVARAKVKYLLVLKAEAHGQFARAFKKISRSPQLILLTRPDQLKDWLQANLNDQAIVLLSGRMPAGLTDYLTCQF